MTLSAFDWSYLSGVLPKVLGLILGLGWAGYSIYRIWKEATEMDKKVLGFIAGFVVFAAVTAVGYQVLQVDLSQYGVFGLVGVYLGWRAYKRVVR